jgi:hypothetical protein
MNLQCEEEASKIRSEFLEGFQKMYIQTDGSLIW